MVKIYLILRVDRSTDILDVEVIAVTMTKIDAEQLHAELDAENVDRFVKYYLKTLELK